MYDPKGNGRDKSVEAVTFREAEPPARLRGIVHRFLELKTRTELPDSYRFHALPDACTYIILDQLNTDIAGITRLSETSEELDLGTSFHYVNIRFLPGVWKDQEALSHGMVRQPYHGDLPLLSLNRKLADLDFEGKQASLSQFVDHLIDSNRVTPNPVVTQILQHLDDIGSVSDMAVAAGLSARQLQRTLKKTTGFTPHDFLKVLRLQQSIGGEPSLSYADQSHFIHSFRQATGYTPVRYSRKFDV